MFENETIAAIATGLSDSGIGIIRVSGENAVEVGNILFRTPSGNKKLRDADTHTLYYGYIVDIDSENNDEWKDFIIDEVMAVVMRAPRSYTGEDTVEIHCHGGVFVIQKILSAVLKHGARLAAPGEFTKRAFLNGRIDLTKAEAVMDVIQSQNEYALSASVNQLKGSLEKKIKSLRSDIIYEIAFIESALDDPEHVSLEGYPEKLEEKLDLLSKDIDALISTAEEGKLIKEGIKTVILGKPNAGKSSLMNLFAGEERAIVTDIAGTTRDSLKENVRFQGINFELIDTAGIRDTKDVIEKIGVEKSKKLAGEADLILYVVDTSVPLDENDRDIVSIINGKNVIILLNKSDMKNIVTEEDISILFSGNKRPVMISTSAKYGLGVKEFEQTVKNMFFNGEINVNREVVITNIRHKEALQEAYNSLKLVNKSIQKGLPEDFFSIDLMNAYAALGRIIGEEVDEDLVEEIFSKFCMGK